MGSSPDNPGITYCGVVWQLEETLKHESAIDLLIKLSAVLLHYYSPSHRHDTIVHVRDSNLRVVRFEDEHTVWDHRVGRLRLF